MIYLVGGSKGGVGKSTMACNMAAFIALVKRRRVCLVDTDVQKHATSWAILRKDITPALPTVWFAEAYGSVAPTIRNYAEQYDDVVVDAGGRDSKELRAALRVADIVIMPFVPSQFDLYSVDDMSNLIEVAREYNPPLRAIGFINRASNNWVMSRKADAAQAMIASYAEVMECATTVIHDREAFKVAAGEGRAVAEIGSKGDAATDEFARLMDEIDPPVSEDDEGEENELEHDTNVQEQATGS